MRILITGNLGYVGPLVVRRLRGTRPDAELIGLDTGFFAHCLTRPGAYPERLLDQQRYADVRAMPAAILDGVDAVVHLAAISNDPMGNEFEEVTLDINHRASVELADQARQAGVRHFVFASSCSMYGSGGGAARTESSELNPLTAYARSKVWTERDLRGMAGADFQVTALRFATACGMSDRLRLDLVLNDFVAAATVDKRITVLSDGSPWRPLIHVRDMARAIDWAIDRPVSEHAPAFLAVNTGSDVWNYQIRDLATAVAEVLPGTDVSIKRSYSVDFGLYRALAPDHQPQVDLRAAVEELAAGLADIGFADSDFRHSDWMRLRVLTGLRERGALSTTLHWTD
jgi:nucleoside-diphosphate-sugar epimerase